MSSLLLICLWFGSQPDPQTPATPASPIVFPNLTPPTPPPQPQPPPPPTPVVPTDEPTPLGGDIFYVVTSDSPFLAFSSPQEGLKITRETGPIKIRGRFIEAPDKIQTKEFKQKHVVCVEAGAFTGKCELICWPLGATEESQASRRKFLINQLPIPPPGPTPPQPPQPPPTPSGEVRAMFVQESKTTTPAEANLMNAAEIRELLNQKCVKVGDHPEWRKFDKDDDLSKESETWQEIWKTLPRDSAEWKDKLPYLVIFNGSEGVSYQLSPIDPVKKVRRTLTVAELKAIILKHTGGKDGK